jgi:succinate-semialdehyde dehydrogenase/glutarate-semialdehyde dehydrogenase
MIVLRGANLKKAAEMAVAGAFGSAGQLCVSIERVYVPNELKADFIEALRMATESLKVGRSNDFSFDVGSLTSAGQLARVSGFIEDAIDNGAVLVAGGHALPELGPYFYAPTVVSEVKQIAKMARQEVFGPVLDVEGYEDIEEAIELANDTDYGLNASIVGPQKEALKIAEQLHAGSVNVNEGFRASFASMESPMGGMKTSGMGRRNGPGGLLKFTEAKTIGVASGLLKLPMRGRDYNRMAPLMNALQKILKRIG